MSRISFNNPFNWIANKLSPAISEKEDKISHELARQKQAEQGTGNLFDVAAAETGKSTLAGPVAPRKKYTEVYIPQFPRLSNADPSVAVSSINTQLPTSRFLKGNSTNSDGR